MGASTKAAREGLARDARSIDRLVRPGVSVQFDGNFRSAFATAWRSRFALDSCGGPQLTEKSLHPAVHEES